MSSNPRDEAERLIAAALGVASTAIQGAELRRQLRDIASAFAPPATDRAGQGAGAGERPQPALATGSAACCVCPVCRLIDQLRDPDPYLVERLASAAGDIAVGLAGALRAFGDAGRRSAQEDFAAADDHVAPRDDAGEVPDGGPHPGGEPADRSGRDVWREATRTPPVDVEVDVDMDVDMDVDVDNPAAPTVAGTDATGNNAGTDAAGSDAGAATDPAGDDAAVRGDRPAAPVAGTESEVPAPRRAPIARKAVRQPPGARPDGGPAAAR
jgi:hypothetical protein